jgi:A/G-specific adenine glycosylase
MARVLERYFGPRTLVDIRYDPYLQDLSREVVTVDDPVSMNWAVLDHAAIICKPKVPRCSSYPLAEKCNFVRLRAARQELQG